MIYLSENNTLPMVFCFENYSGLLWEKCFSWLRTICVNFSIFETEHFLNLSLEISQIATIKIPIGTSNFNVKTKKKVFMQLSPSVLVAPMLDTYLLLVGIFYRRIKKKWWPQAPILRKFLIITGTAMLQKYSQVISNVEF